MTDFLSSRGTRKVRREIRNIVRSYHHYWDPLAELLQNARDAAARSMQSDPDRKVVIRLLVDAESRTVEVLDNGTGIAKAAVTDLLGPGGGDKDEDDDQIGEKGVGLTYAIFCSDEFVLESRHDNDHHRGRVVGARKWLRDQDPDRSLPIYEALDPEKCSPLNASEEVGGQEYDFRNYTRVRLAGLPSGSDDPDFFSFTFEQLKYLVLTRTAAGVVGGLFVDDWESPFDLYIEFKTAGEDGIELFEKVDAAYPVLHELIDPKYVIEAGDAGIKLAGLKTERQKRKLVGGKAIWARRTVTGKKGEDITVYGLSVPGNPFFKDLAEQLELLADRDSHDASLLESGIFVSTKGMPTGMTIKESDRGQYHAYYKRCLFVVNSDSLAFDLGRKSIHHIPRKRLQDAVYEVFKLFENLAPLQTTGRPHAKPPTKSKARRDAEAKAAWKHYRGLVPLDCSEISFEKRPHGQEAGVAAIFHELLGAGLLKGYRPLATGYGTRYDLHALYDTDDGEELELVIEYKHSLEALVGDLQNGRKHFDSVHLLVAWDASEQKLLDAGFELETGSDSELQGATHDLSIPVDGVEPIPVILLSDFLKDEC